MMNAGESVLARQAGIQLENASHARDHTKRARRAGSPRDLGGMQETDTIALSTLRIRTRCHQGTDNVVSVLPFVLGLAMDTSVRDQSPRLLFIAREFWKAGHEAALNRMEGEAARICIGLGVPHPFLAVESLTGSKEVWYINGFDSSDEVSQVAAAYSKNPALTSAMKRFATERAAFASEPSREALAAYRPELSRGPEWVLGHGRFLVIAVTRGNTQSDGTVFETDDGVRIVIIAAETRADAEKKLSSAGGDAKIFAVRPEFSMPAAEWIAGDPSFWASSAQKR